MNQIFITEFVPLVHADSLRTQNNTMEMVAKFAN